jgi:DNA-binding GntR family transcriptional regulator
MPLYPDLDRIGPVPIYVQIEAWIREQIAVGTWPARFKLKAEVDLAQELDVSRGTVRKAITELIAEGLLTQTHGRGTFVAPHMVEQPLADRLITFSEDLISKGIAFETRVIDQAVIIAKGRIATLLDLRTGTRVFYLKRIRLVDGEPLIVLNNYVVYDACPGVETVDFTTERLFHVLEDRYGLKLARGRRTFQAQVADREIAHLLEMKPGDAVMNVEQLAFLEGGSVIECSDLWLRGDCFRLIAAVSRTGNGNVGFSMSMLPGVGPGANFP